MNISIVTVHLNDFEGLQLTHRSLRSLLSESQVTWLLIDGGSKAETEAQKACFNQVKQSAEIFVSEPDNGIYDAMNKGTGLAVGDYVLYLNAGDELHPEFDWQGLQKALIGSDADMLWGTADVRDSTGKVYPRKTRQPVWLRYGMAVSHQAIFFRRSLIGDNPYNTDFIIAADYDLICRLYTANAHIEAIDLPVCIFDLAGKSTIDKRLTLREELLVRSRLFNTPVLIDRLIIEFKHVMWRLGTFSPAFRRAWSRFF